MKRRRKDVPLQSSQHQADATKEVTSSESSSEVPESAEGSTSSPDTRYRSLLLMGVAATVLLVGLWYFLTPRRGASEAALAETPPEDPRLTYATPFRNVRPDVEYVGDQACVGCHREVSHAFHQHSMGRSITPIADIAPGQQYDTNKNNPFHVQGKEYRVESTGTSVFHKETIRDPEGSVVVQTQAEVQFAIGSGTHACSYLIVRGDHVIQSPISWFSQARRWDLSPGFTRRENAYSRPVQAECLFCHCNRVEPVDGSVNRYHTPLFPQGAAIGCERCHGPGELHVQERTKHVPVTEKVDYTIVNPRDLQPELREAVCQQCHLEGEQRVLRRGRQQFDFRPGLPIDLFRSTFVFVPELEEQGTFAGHVEEMHASRCFAASQGKMGCVTCHDPHEPLTRIKPELYRQQCINCHQDKGCSLPLPTRQKNQDNCIACHMDRRPSSDIQHTAITDHRIPKKKGANHSNHRLLDPGESPLVNFHSGKPKAGDLEAHRDLGIALSMMMNDPSPANRQLAEIALPLLDDSLKRWPSDVPALEAKAFVLNELGQSRAALGLVEPVLARFPDREMTLAAAAKYAQQAGDLDKALTHSRKASTLNPYLLAWRERLVELYLQSNQFDQAVSECRDVLALYPTSLRVRTLLVSALLQSRQPARAKQEFETILKMNPPNKVDLQQWFEKQQLR